MEDVIAAYVEATTGQPRPAPAPPAESLELQEA
jgi:hypothetical protein